MYIQTIQAFQMKIDWFCKRIIWIYTALIHLLDDIEILLELKTTFKCVGDYFNQEKNTVNYKHKKKSRKSS